MPESQLASFGEAQLISRFGLVAAPPSLSGSVENIELSGREERKIAEQLLHLTEKVETIADNWLSSLWCLFINDTWGSRICFHGVKMALDVGTEGRSHQAEVQSSSTAQ